MVGCLHKTHRQLSVICAFIGSAKLRCFACILTTKSDMFASNCRFSRSWVSVLMRKIAILCVVALFGMQPSVPLAKELPATVKAVAAAMVKLGYTEVGVSLRVFGGFVLQGKMADTFVMIALSEDGTLLDRVEVFVDGDLNGVFGINESLGFDDQRSVINAIVAAFPDGEPITLPQGEGGQVALSNDLNVVIPGFEQKFETSLTGTSMRVTASEKVGVDVPAFFEVITLTSKEADGQQNHGSTRTQVAEVAGLRSQNKDTNVSQSGGTTIGLTPPDAAEMRNNVLASAPNANTLREQIELHVPTAEGIRAGIVSPP